MRVRACVYCHFDTPSHRSLAQAAVSTFSCGPVAPSDGIGFSDSSLIMKSCMADGTLLQVCACSRSLLYLHQNLGDQVLTRLNILQPDRPATGMDAHFLNSAFGNLGANGRVRRCSVMSCDVMLCDTMDANDDITCRCGRHTLCSAVGHTPMCWACKWSALIPSYLLRYVGMQAYIQTHSPRLFAVAWLC